MGCAPTLAQIDITEVREHEATNRVVGGFRNFLHSNALLVIELDTFCEALDVPLAQYRGLLGWQPHRYLSRQRERRCRPEVRRISLDTVENNGRHLLIFCVCLHKSAFERSPVPREIECERRQPQRDQLG